MERTELLGVIEAESAFRRKFKKRLNIAMVVLIGLSAASLGYLIAVEHDTSSVAMFACLIALLGVGAGVRPAHREAVLAVAKSADPQTAAYLCELLDSTELEMSKIVHETLAATLPKVTAEDAHLFTPEQRRQLAHSLLVPQTGAYLEAAVQALSHIGTLSEIDALETVVAKKSVLADAPAKDRASSRASMALAEIRMREARVRIEAADPLLSKGPTPAILEQVGEVVEGSA